MLKSKFFIFISLLKEMKVFTDEYLSHFFSLVAFSYFVNLLSDIKLSFWYIISLIFSLLSFVAIAITEILVIKKKQQIDCDTRKDGKIDPDIYILTTAENKYRSTIKACLYSAIFCFILSVVFKISDTVNFCINIENRFNFQLCLNILYSAILYALLAISVSIPFTATRFLNLTHSIAITLPVYFVFIFNKQNDSFILHIIYILISVLISTAIITLVNQMTYKLVAEKNKSSMPPMIASIGIMLVMQNIISILWGDETQTLLKGDIKIGYEFFGAHITDIQIITILVCIILFVSYVLFMKYSLIGRNIRAVASNPELSNIIGIPANRIILWAFAIGTSLAAIAGILIAFDTGIRPTMGFSWLLYGIIAMIIGGAGSNLGMVGGALLLATIQHFTAYYVNSQWMDPIAYIILILFLIVRPLGFSGKRLKKIEI